MLGRLRQCVLLVIISILLSGGGVFADTVVGGLISTNTHWTAGSGPYIATTSVVIVNGATLTIDPGVEVRFAPDMRLEVHTGQMIARGTPTDQIRFTTTVSGSVSDTDRWDYIRFSDDSVDATFDYNGDYTGGSIIEHAIIEYAGGRSTVAAFNSAPYISHCLIQENATTGILVWYANGLRIHSNSIVNNNIGNGAGVELMCSNNVSLAGNIIAGNQATFGSALWFRECDDLTLSGDRIVDNFGAASENSGVYAAGGSFHSQRVVLSADPTNPTWITGNYPYQVFNAMWTDGNIDARNVWWGTVDEAEIVAGIYDYVDSPSFGMVFYEPWAIPEPATLSLLVLGGLALIRRRKSRA